MTWASRGANSTPSAADYIDGHDTNEIRLTNPAHAYLSTAAHVLTRLEADTVVENTGTPAAATSQSLVTKAQVEAVRAYYLDDEVPNGFDVTWNDALSRMVLTWTNDSDILSWAQSDVEIEIQRKLNFGSFAALNEVGWSTQYNDTMTPDGQLYTYRIRYRRASDNADVGPWSLEDSDTAGDGT